ncbi:MAG: ParB N-terminal domain-containing protein [Colwellia sp.]|nr:ParB N-terminal domain-containing protein [Colwellia sp.]
MVKKFGSKNRAGTGSIEKDNNSTANTEKWAGAIASQMLNKDKVKEVIVKTIPIDFIKADQDNPRKLAIDLALIKNIVEKHPIQQFIRNEQCNDWIEEYVEKITKAYNLEGKQIGDFTSIVEFAAVLKSPERLLHPIVVWREESIFHLIAGERRVLAFAQLNESHISAKICDTKPDESEIDILQWEENVSREDMSLYERTIRIQKFVKATTPKNISVRKLAKITGLSVAESHRYLAVIKYETDTLINAIKDGKVKSIKLAQEYSKLSEEDLQMKLSGKKNQVMNTVKPMVKISKDVDINVIKKIINTITKEYNADAVLKDLDLSKTKDINLAFNLLINFLSEDK